MNIILIILFTLLIYQTYSTYYIISDIILDIKYDNTCEFKFHIYNTTSREKDDNRYNSILFNRNNNKIFNISRHNDRFNTYNMIAEINDNNLNIYESIQYNIYKHNYTLIDHKFIKQILLYKYLYDNIGCNCYLIKNNIIDNKIYICYYYHDYEDINKYYSIKIYIDKSLSAIYPYKYYKHNNDTLKTIIKTIKMYYIDLYYYKYKQLLKTTYNTDLIKIIKLSSNYINNIWFERENMNLE